MVAPTSHTGYAAVIFDLDGTLLDTLDDLAAAVNHALAAASLPPRTNSQVRAFLGNGIRQLMRLSVGEGQSEVVHEQALATFRQYYMAHCTDRTRPFPGIEPLLQALKEGGVRTAIVSNKLQPAVTALHQRYFPATIGVALGESATVRRKPAPDSILAAMQQLGVQPAATLYVGDSEVDLTAARAAGVACASCTWGFRSREQLVAAGAQWLVDTPEQLLHALVPQRRD